MNSPDASRALSQTQRDHLETFVAGASEPSPWWQYPGISLSIGVAIAVLDIGSRWIAVPLALIAVLAAGAFVGATTRRSGAIPHLRGMPRPLRAVLVAYWALSGVLLAAVLAWALLTDGSWVFARAGVMVAAIIGIGGWLADRSYRRAATRLAGDTAVAGG